MGTFDIVVAKLRIDGVAVVNWIRADQPLIANALTLHEREGADIEILGYYPHTTGPQQRHDIYYATREAEEKHRD